MFSSNFLSRFCGWNRTKTKLKRESSDQRKGEAAEPDVFKQNVSMATSSSDLSRTETRRTSWPPVRRVIKWVEPNFVSLDSAVLATLAFKGLKLLMRDNIWDLSPAPEGGARKNWIPWVIWIRSLTRSSSSPLSCCSTFGLQKVWEPASGPHQSLANMNPVSSAGPQTSTLYWQHFHYWYYWTRTR